MTSLYTCPPPQTCLRAQGQLHVLNKPSRPPSVAHTLSLLSSQGPDTWPCPGQVPYVCHTCTSICPGLCSYKLPSLPLHPRCLLAHCVDPTRCELLAYHPSLKKKLSVDPTVPPSYHSICLHPFRGKPLEIIVYACAPHLPLSPQPTPIL